MRYVYLLPILACATVFAQAPALSLGANRELFCDRHLIDHLDGAQLRLATPVARETVLQFDAPWEGRYCGYVTVLQDGDRYRMYYRGLPNAGKDGSDAEVTCYAESADGVAWAKPPLGLHEAGGSTDNSIVLAGAAPYSHNFAPFLDARPGVPDSERYKAIAGTSDTGLHGFVSADGLRWQKLDGPLITEGAFDSQNVAFWSEAEGQYLCYFRTWSEGGYKGYRSVSRATSKDFRTWSMPVAMTFGDTPMEHLYTNQTQPYFRAPQVYVSLAARFMPGRRVLSAEAAQAAGVEEQYAGDCSDSVFITSRGGSVYNRTFMEGFIKPDIGLKNWSSRTNYPACGIVPTGEQEMSFYVQADYGQPTHHLVRYTLRPDGFASVWGPYAGGEMVTKQFTFTGDRLLLNFATSAAGGLRVEVQDAAGAPLPGFALDDCPVMLGNFLEQPVVWKDASALGSLAGQPIRLRFELQDAELFALRFAEGVQ
jgi:hypothetical protein